MKNNGTIFNVGPDHGALPRLCHTMSTTIETASYHHRGTFRKDFSYCFQYSISGEGVMRYGSKLYRLKPGTAFFCRISDPALEYYYREDGSEPWNFFWCAIEGETFYTIADEIFSQFGPFYQIPFDDPVITELFNHSQRELNTQSIDRRQNARLAMQLMTTLTLHGQQTLNSEEGSIMDRALQFIQNHIDKTINASDVANALNVSREHLSRLFKQQLKKSPYQVICEQKLKLASSYLEGTHLPIKEVALKVGIPAHQFSSWFKKQAGFSPKDFRKR